MTFHSPQEPLGSCCPDSAPSSRSLFGPKVKGRMASPRLQPCRPGTRVHTWHTAGLVREAACAAGAAVCCVQLWFLAGARLRGRHGLSRWAPCSACASSQGQTECSSSGRWGSLWACFPMLGIIPARWGGGGRQDKLSRCAWPRAPVI